MNTHSAEDSGQTLHRSSRSRFRVAAAFLCAIAVVVGVTAWFLIDVPWPSPAEVTSRRTIVLGSADGHDLFHKGNLQLPPVDAKDMPADLVNAVLSTCNVSACALFYRSFRASDCTYQPYWGGPRQYCGR